MNSELYFAYVYSSAARMIRAAIIDEPRGLVLSIDMGGSFFDCLASDLARATDYTFVQAPSLARYRSRILDYGTSPKPSDIVGEPVLFGRADGWMQIVDDANLNKRYSLNASSIATRSIDRWAIGRSKLRLVHFGDMIHSMEQIEGATNVLLEDRPVLTFYPPANPLRARLLSGLEQLEYRVVDIAGLDAQAEEPERQLDFGWIAIPAETTISVPTDAAESATSGTYFASTLFNRYEMARHSLPRHHRSGAVFKFDDVGPPELRRAISIDDAVIVNDSYPVESDGKVSWRWLGPRTRSRIALPCAFPGTYRFEVAVLSCKTQGGLGACRVLVEGREVPTKFRGNDKGEIEFVGYLAPENYRGYVEIDFVNAGSIPPNGNDPRVLRLCLTSIEVSPCM